MRVGTALGSRPCVSGLLQSTSERLANPEQAPAAACSSSSQAILTIKSEIQTRQTGSLSWPLAEPIPAGQHPISRPAAEPKIVLVGSTPARHSAPEAHSGRTATQGNCESQQDVDTSILTAVSRPGSQGMLAL